MPERRLSTNEIAAHPGGNPDTFHKWITPKSIPALKVDHLWPFMASDMDEWVRIGKSARDEHRE